MWEMFDSSGQEAEPQVSQQQQHLNLALYALQGMCTVRALLLSVIKPMAAGYNPVIDPVVSYLSFAIYVKRYTFKITKFIYVNLQHLCARTRVGGVLSFPSSLSQGLFRATVWGDGPQIVYFRYLCLIGCLGGQYVTDCIQDTYCPARYSAVLRGLSRPSLYSIWGVGTHRFGIRGSSWSLSTLDQGDWYPPRYHS
jgi:hypothetical protein